MVSSSLPATTGDNVRKGDARYVWPRAVRSGSVIYVGAQTAIDKSGQSAGDGNIEAQTALVFEGLVESLEAAGGGMRDLVKLHTYYQFVGDGSSVTQYWERMTKIRLNYLADPGPAATAVRVIGAPTRDSLIEVDGIGIVGSDRRRLMPAHAWDWSIPTPFSQGWKVDDKLFVGGQISADRSGKALFPGQVRAQTRKTLEYIDHVLREGGSSWRDMAYLKICFKSVDRGQHDRELLNIILEEVRKVVPEPRPALTAFGVDLLYEGLELEIDGIAVTGQKAQVTQGDASLKTSDEDFPIAVRSGDEIYFGGLAAPSSLGLWEQAEATIQILLRILSAQKAKAEDVVKLTVFYVPDKLATDPRAEYHRLMEILAEHFPQRSAALSIAAVPLLREEKQRILIDGVVVIGADRTAHRFYPQ